VFEFVSLFGFVSGYAFRHTVSAVNVWPASAAGFRRTQGAFFHL